jgi:hypothetical protein
MDSEQQVSALLIGHHAGICLSCLSASTALSVEEVRQIIERFREVAPVKEWQEPCSKCRVHAQTFSIHYPI